VTYQTVDAVGASRRPNVIKIAANGTDGSPSRAAAESLFRRKESPHDRPDTRYRYCHDCFFQLHGVNRASKPVLKRRIMRDQLLHVIAQIEPCMIAIEACTGPFYWQCEFGRLRYRARTIRPQKVEPFFRRQNNGGSDAVTSDRVSN